MDIKELQKHWNEFGRTEPLWAIFTVKRLWDPDEFFRTGEEHVSGVMDQIRALGLSFNSKSCLDFGCGVGRITQAFCHYFEECHGVDIAPSMIELAKKYNRHGKRCHYHLNETPDLSLFDDNSFDFVHSFLVLQHIEPKYSKEYIKEFLRVLAPGGLVVFQVPAHFELIDQDLLLERHRLSASAFNAQITVEKPFATIEPGVQKTLTVRVKNRSNTTWPASMPVGVTHEIRLGNHWLDANGQTIVQDDGRAYLPRDVNTGEEVVISLPVTGPRDPGDYILEIDLVQEGVAWFKDMQSETVTVQVRNTYGKVGDVYHKLSYFFRKPSNGPETFTPIMEMYSLKKEEISEIVQENGGTIVHVQEVSGEGYISSTYFIRK